MFVLKKIITPFLLPPGLFICLLVMAAILSTGRRKDGKRAVYTAMAALIWMLSLSPVADLFTAPLESDFPVPDDPAADVIIMLGGGVLSKSPDLSGRGAPGPATMERMVTTARLQRRLNIPIIVSGGPVFSAGASSARLARRFLMDLGVPEMRIIVEDRSRDTYENALFSRDICRQRGFNAPLLVTSGYHLKRSKLSFDKVGLKVTPFPCALTTWPDKAYQWYDFLPNAGALAATSAALHEWLGLLYYDLAY